VRLRDHTVSVLWFLAFVALALSVTCHQQEAKGQTSNAAPPVVISITDFGQPMRPNWNHFGVNNPKNIIKSENMYSLQFGGRQLRHGYHEISDSANFNSTFGGGGMDALGVYHPAEHLRWMLFATNGKWGYGNLDTTTIKMKGARMAPFLSGPDNGEKLEWKDDSIWYDDAGPEFFVHVQVGDTISFGDPLPTDFAREVRWVVENRKLILTSGSLTHDSGTYTLRRGYPDDSAIAPFIIQYADLAYTGTKRSRPQVIYPKSATTLGIRPLGIADSMQIDDIHFKFGDTSSAVKSYDTATDTKEYLNLIEVVDRRKGWSPDQWAESVFGAPESFYLRLGARAGDSLDVMTYRILGSTDSSLYVAAVFVDTVTDNALLYGKVRVMGDTVDFEGFEGGTGYIMGSSGDFQVVHTGASDLTIDAGGALLYTDDSLDVDSLQGIGGLYFVRPTEPVAVSINRAIYWTWDTQFIECGTGGEVVLGSGCVVTDGPWETWYNGKCYQGYVVRCPIIDRPDLPTENVYLTVDQNTFFPILDIEHDSDTMFMRSGHTWDASADSIVISSWEIVRARMPFWSDMVEYDRRLWAWGDTTNPGVMSRSKEDLPGALGPGAWSAADDIRLGNDPSDPITAAAAYHNQLMVGTRDHLYSTLDGVRFEALAVNIGIVSRRGLYLHNREAYLLSDDGWYKVQRRDLSGLSLVRLVPEMDPVFNAWGLSEYGADIVPYSVNPALRDQSMLVFNERDQYLYMLFAEGTSTTVNRAMAYDINRGGVSGVFTFGAGAAMTELFRDTTRLIFGAADTSLIYSYDYTWADDGVGIDGVIRSAPFFIKGPSGEPTESSLGLVRIHYRGASGSIDSASIKLIGDNATTEKALTPSASIKNYTDYITDPNNRSVFWQWEIYVEGSNAGGVFMPQHLHMEFVPERKDD